MKRFFHVPRFAIFDPETGDPVQNGKVYFYQNGTTTLQTIYSDYARTTPADNPVILDARGEGLAVLQDVFYSIRVEDASANLVYTQDNIAPPFTERVYASDFATVQDAVDSITTGVVDLGSDDHALASDLTLKSGITLVGYNASFSGAGDVLIQGTAAGNTSDVATDGSRGDKTLVVDDGTQFSANDWVEIVAGGDEHDNATKIVPGELNQVISIATNTLTLRYPLSHDYTTGFTPEPFVAVVDDLLENVAIEGVTFTGGKLLCEYVKGLRVTAKFENSGFGDGLVEGAIRDATLDLNTYREAGVGSGPNTEVHLANTADFKARVRTYGGWKDSLRVWGCAQGTIDADLIETSNRSVWAYKSNNVDIRPFVLGSQVETINLEILIHDFCNECVFIGGHVNETAKTTDVNVYETRGSSENCGVRGTTFVLPDNLVQPIGFKGSAVGSFVRGCLFLNYRTSHNILCKLDDGSAPQDTSSVFIEDNVVVNMDPLADFTTLIRTDTITNFLADYPLIVVKNNKIPRGAFASLAGVDENDVAWSGFRLKQLVVSGNLTTDPTAVATDVVALPDLPITRVTGSGNSHASQNNMEVNLGDDGGGNSNVAELYWEGPEALDATDPVPAKMLFNGLGTESANAEEPTAASWQAGSIVNFTDSGDGSGTGVYLLAEDGATWQTMAAAHGITSLTDNTGGSADNTLENLADGNAYANDHAAIENNFADLAAKINEILGKL